MVGHWQSAQTHTFVVEAIGRRAPSCRRTAWAGWNYSRRRRLRRSCSGPRAHLLELRTYDQTRGSQFAPVFKRRVARQHLVFRPAHPESSPRTTTCKKKTMGLRGTTLTNTAFPEPTRPGKGRVSAEQNERETQPSEGDAQTSEQARRAQPSRHQPSWQRAGFISQGGSNEADRRRARPSRAAHAT